MKCNVVRDLLPLYLEQLCEEKTSKEIKDHLEGCEECRQRWEEMGGPVESMIDQLENETVSIEPMKKYQKKIKKKNRMLVLLLLLSVTVIGILSYLSYGQINRTGHSFETISQYIRFTHIGKEFARGNLEPLLSSIVIVGDDPEYAYYAKQAYSGNERFLVQDTKEYIRNGYPDFFQGKSLKLRKVQVEYHTNLLYETRNLLVVLVYEIDGIEYFIRLERSGGEQYYVTGDEFVESTEPVTYTIENEGDEIEDSDSEAEENDVEDWSPLLQCKESLFHSLPPFGDMEFYLARRTIRSTYQECEESGETLSPYVFMTSLLYTTEECLGDSKLRYAYEEALREHAKQIIQQNYWIKDMDYHILSYDKEKHMFRYQINLLLVQRETGEECVLSAECYRYSSKWMVILGTEKLIGENIAEEARRAMLNLWKVD